ncbi:MAG TPA: sigma-70 family RNA polymerase sigma factor [Anaerolineae bacterium]|nr:sigma-70 family RNA polymerase sigma factor [Anaerolineae bacterium]
MLNLVQTPHLAAAQAGDSDEFGSLTEPYRRELQLHCYRLLGSLHEAEDLVQETLLRAWRRLDTYEGRASFRAWLYKIATNACLDTLDKRPRRALPVATQPRAELDQPPAPPGTDPIWLEPFPDELLPEATALGPEARYAMRESISLAFLAALQLLPPRQRAVLILRDVLDWRASEVAELLDMPVSAANSTLQRARTTLAQHYRAGHSDSPPPADETMLALLDRYMRAWESADVTALVALLKEDAVLSMPPSSAWYQGRVTIAAFLRAVPFAQETGRWRARPTRANGQPAVAFYQWDETGQIYRAFGIQVLSLDHAGIAEMTTFINPAHFSLFDLPAEIK